MGFFYSFTETLMHSFWQAALLVIMYAGITAAAINMHPLQKRNVLYNLLVLQILVSCCTFYIYFFENNNSISFFKIPSFNWLTQFSGLIFYSYFTFILFKVSILCIQFNLFKKQYKSALINCNPDIKIFTKLKVFQLGIKRQVTVWYSKNVQVPITFGFLKPIILLPFSLLNNISMEETEILILHELAHIKSKDYLLNWLLVIVETIYFFNPFIKLLIEKLKIEREKNCDLQVINFNYNEILYAQVLLKIAKNGYIIKNFQMGAVSKSSQLLQRILFFSNDKNMLFKKYPTAFLGLIIFPLFFFTVLFLMPQHKKNITNNIFIIALPKHTITKKINFHIFKEIENKYAKIPDKKTTLKQIKIVAKPIIPIFSEVVYEKELLIQHDDYYKLVSCNEAQLDSAKELLYNIETSQGKMTKSFKVYKINGKWVIQPQWIIVEKNMDSVSTTLKKEVMYLDVDSIQ